MSKPKYLRQLSNNHIYGYSEALALRVDEFKPYDGKIKVVNGIAVAVGVKSNEELKAEAVADALGLDAEQSVVDNDDDDDGAQASTVEDDLEAELAELTKMQIVAKAKDELGINLDVKNNKDALVAQFKAAKEQLG